MRVSYRVARQWANQSHSCWFFVTRGTLASPTSTPDMSQKSRLSLVGFCRDLELQIYWQMRSEVYSLGIVLLGSQRFADLSASQLWAWHGWYLKELQAGTLGQHTTCLGIKSGWYGRYLTAWTVLLVNDPQSLETLQTSGRHGMKAKILRFSPYWRLSNPMLRVRMVVSCSAMILV